MLKSVLPLVGSCKSKEDLSSRVTVLQRHVIIAPSYFIDLPDTTSHLLLPRKLPRTITQTPPRPPLTPIPSNLNPRYRPPPRRHPRRTAKQHLDSGPRSGNIDDGIPEPHEWKHDTRGVRERDRDQRGVD